MKKILFVLFIVFYPFLIQSQNISEKLIHRFDGLTDVDVYSFKYDEKTGSFLYVKYDSTKQLKSSLISNKGNSGDYDYINSYNAIFDSDGNYYLTVEIKTSDTTYSNAFMKNGKEIMSYEIISMEPVEKNGIIYLVCTEKNKSFLIKYEISTGNISKGKSYDELIPCQYSKNQVEGEPVASLGFTEGDKVYYIAKLNSEAFMVIGDAEQKHYSDIDAYTVIQDKSGRFAFVAKDTGSFMYSTDGFVVHGDKRYKTFYSIYNLITDANNNIVYIAGDISADLYPQRIMRGDKEISKTYSGGIYNLNFTPEGKLYFIASEKKKNSDDYESFVVLDGKEGKRYQSINSAQVLSGNELVYIAQKSEDKYIIVKGDEEIRVDKKLSVLSAELVNNNLAYICAEYGNYEKKINDKYYVHFLDNRMGQYDNKFGPYDGMMVLNYENQNYILSDGKGNYAYVTYRISSNSDYYYLLYTNRGKSKEFDNISDVKLYKGKALYSVSRLADKDNYIYKYRIYYDNKPLTPEYDSIVEFKFDDKTGLVSYLIAKGNEIYKVEIKL